MSSHFKKPRSTDTDKVQIFKIDSKGSVTPAYSDERSGPNHHSSYDPLEESLKSDLIDKMVPKEFPLAGESVDIPEPLSELESHVKPGDSSLSNAVDLSDDVPDYDKQESQPVNDYRIAELTEKKLQLDPQIEKLSNEVELLSQRNSDLDQQLKKHQHKEDSLQREVKNLQERHRDDLLLQRKEYEERVKRITQGESIERDFDGRQQQWKETIREDLKRIRLKEKELENKYDLLKRDTQTLLDSKDRHLLELTQKNDSLELELEGHGDRLREAQNVLGAIEAKKHRLIETLRLAIALLEEIDTVTPSEPENITRRTKT